MVLGLHSLHQSQLSILPIHRPGCSRSLWVRSSRWKIKRFAFQRLDVWSVCHGQGRSPKHRIPPSLLSSPFLWLIWFLCAKCKTCHRACSAGISYSIYIDTLCVEALLHMLFRLHNQCVAATHAIFSALLRARWPQQAPESYGAFPILNSTQLTSQWLLSIEVLLCHCQTSSEEDRCTPRGRSFASIQYPTRRFDI